MQSPTKILFVAFFLLSAFAACKKASNTAHDALIGKWIFSKSVTDANNNGVVDPAELAQANAPIDSSVYPSPLPYVPGFVLNGNAKGTSLDLQGSPGTLDLQWILYNNNTTLECIFQNRDSTASWALTWLYTIDNITANTLTFKDTVAYSSIHVIHWFIYTKH